MGNMPTMYDNWFANLIVVGATFVAIVLSILTHYEGLIGLSKALGAKARHQRVKVLYAILCLLFLHVVEVWIFGLMLWGLLQWPECGSLSTRSTNVLDAVYFSAVNFSTVGSGDMVPVGPVRFLIGTESLVGLVLITWSASFTYLEMERFWRRG
jgi:hypothetical protein